MVFNWSLSDSRSPQVSRTLLSFLAVFSDVVVWMVFTRPLIIKSSMPFNNPLVTVPKAPITVDTIVTLMCHSFFNSLARSFHIFQFYSVVSQDSKVDNFANSLFFFLVIIIRSGLLAEIRQSEGMSKSHRSLCVSFSRIGAGLCIYHLFVWSNLNFLHISQWITLPTQLCLVLHSFCAMNIIIIIIIIIIYFLRVFHISFS